MVAEQSAVASEVNQNQVSLASRNSLKTENSSISKEVELRRANNDSSIEQPPQVQYDSHLKSTQSNFKKSSGAVGLKKFISHPPPAFSAQQSGHMLGSAAEKWNQIEASKKEQSSGQAEQSHSRGLLDKLLKIQNSMHMSRKPHKQKTQQKNQSPSQYKTDNSALDRRAKNVPSSVAGITEPKQLQFVLIDTGLRQQEKKREQILRCSSSQGFNAFSGLKVPELVKVKVRNPHNEKTHQALAQLEKNQVRLPEMPVCTTGIFESSLHFDSKQGTVMVTRRQSEISENVSQGVLQPYHSTDQVLKQSTNNRTSQQTKSFEARAVTRPNFQPVLQEQKNKVQIRQNGSPLKSHLSPTLVVSPKPKETKLKDGYGFVDQVMKQSRTPFVGQTSTFRERETPDESVVESRGPQSTQVQEREMISQSRLRQKQQRMSVSNNIEFQGSDLQVAPFETPASASHTIINLAHDFNSERHLIGSVKPVQWKRDDSQRSLQQLGTSQAKKKPEQSHGGQSKISGADPFSSVELHKVKAPQAIDLTQTNSIKNTTTSVLPILALEESKQQLSKFVRDEANSLSNAGHEVKTQARANLGLNSKKSLSNQQAISIYSRQLRRPKKAPNNRLQPLFSGPSQLRLQDMHNTSMSRLNGGTADTFFEKDVLSQPILKQKKQKQHASQFDSKQLIVNNRPALSLQQKSLEDAIAKKNTPSKDEIMFNVYSGQGSQKKIAIQSSQQEEPTPEQNAYAEWKTIDVTIANMRNTDPRQRYQPVNNGAGLNVARVEQHSRQSSQSLQNVEEAYCSPKKLDSTGSTRRQPQGAKLQHQQLPKAELIFIDDLIAQMGRPVQEPGSDMFFSLRENKSGKSLEGRNLSMPAHSKHVKGSRESLPQDQTNIPANVNRASKSRIVEDQHMKRTSAILKGEFSGSQQLLETPKQQARANELVRTVESALSLAKVNDSLDSSSPLKFVSKLSSQIAKKSKNHQQQQASLPAKKSQSVIKLFKLEDFDSLGVLGRGSFGQVKLVRHRLSRELFALKQILKERIRGDKHIQHVKSEKQVLKDITHEFQQQMSEASFFVNFVESLQDEENLYLLLEYLPGGELLQQIRENLSLTLEHALFYLAEVLVAIKQLHDRNVIYRDLKPENILLDRKGHIKLIDFGFSKQLKSLRTEKVRTNCGTPAYAAPEVLIGSDYNYKADIWSFGILICELLGGFTPFGPKAMEIGVAQDGFDKGSPGLSSMPVNQIIEMVQTGRIILPKNLTPLTRDLVRKILVADPSMRLEIKDIMQHKFFEGVDWQKVASKQTSPPHVPRPTSAERLSNEAPEKNLSNQGELTDDLQADAAMQKEPSVKKRQTMLSKGQAGSTNSLKLNQSPYVKRANPNKILGDFHLTKLNAIFEDF